MHGKMDLKLYEFHTHHLITIKFLVKETYVWLRICRVVLTKKLNNC